MTRFRPALLGALVGSMGLLAMLAGCSGGYDGSKVAPTAPGAPTQLTATSGNAQVSLSWSAVSGATSYNIYYSTSAGVTPSSGTKVSGLTATTDSVTGLTNGTTYYFVVTAVNAAGESPASSAASATPDETLPAAPQSLMATAGNAQVSLTWTASSTATSYNLYYSTTAGVTPANGTKVSGLTSTSYTQTSLTNGTTYYFVVTAVNQGGESGASNQASATPTGPSLGAPANLTATPGSTQVTLSWTGASGATSYNVYYSTTAGVTPTNGTKISGVSGTSTVVPNLTGCVTYYFVVTAVEGSSESSASNQAVATANGTVSVALTPGTAGSVTLAANSSTSLTFNFPANAVTQATTVSLAPLTQAQLPATLPTSKGTYVGAYQMCFSPSSVTTLSAPATITGTVASSYATGTSLNLAEDQSNAWTDVATFIVGNSSALNENLATPSLPGVLGAGAYLLYQPAAGANTSISNLGVVIVPDDSTLNTHGIQFVSFFNSTGGVSTTPTLQFLAYPNAGDLDGASLTPEGGQGVVVDGGNNIYFFTGLLTGNLVSSSTVLNIANYGGDGDSIVIFPNGDEAVATGDGNGQLVYITGILSGSPVIAATIPFSTSFSNDGLILAKDGSWLMARGGGNPGLTLYSIASIAPTPGAFGGTVTHSFTPQNVSGTILSPTFEDGRNGMAISPADPSRAVIAGQSSGSAPQVQLITGLPLSATASAPVAVPAPCTYAASVAVSVDGTYAVVGCDKGLVVYTGVNTGTLTQVGSVYAPTYTNPCQPNSAFASPCTSSTTATLGNGGGFTLSLTFTLDGKYVAVTDSSNDALVLIPVSASGFGAVASVRGNIGTPYNDQIIAH